MTQWQFFLIPVANIILVYWLNNSCFIFYFFLWLYSPIFGLGRLHKTFRFISVTRSRTVGWTPLTGDQLVARPLCVCPGWLWGWRSWRNERFWQGKPKYSEKTCPDTTLSTTIPNCQIRERTRAATAGRQRLTASAMARSFCFINVGYIFTRLLLIQPFRISVQIQYVLDSFVLFLKWKT
jgi:hypothetical protein